MLGQAVYFVKITHYLYFIVFQLPVSCPILVQSQSSDYQVPAVKNSQAPLKKTKQIKTNQNKKKKKKEGMS